MKPSRSAAIVSAADKILSFSDFDDPQPFLKQDGAFISFSHKSSDPDIFTLTKQNMQNMYNEFSSGDPDWQWDDARKIKELNSPKTRCITLHFQSKLVGFAAFRFLVDAKRPVLYLWEFQVDPAFQGRGLGKYLLNQVERFASIAAPAIQAVLLTCLSGNRPAIAFYAHLGYKPDVTSPPKDSKCYVILGKPLN